MGYIRWHKDLTVKANVGSGYLLPPLMYCAASFAGMPLCFIAALMYLLGCPRTLTIRDNAVKVLNGSMRCVLGIVNTLFVFMNM